MEKITVAPMLGRMETHKLGTLLSDPSYVLEPKIDGMRGMIHRDKDGVRILSRTGKDYAGHLPHIVKHVEQFPVGTVFDGEIYFPHADSPFYIRADGSSPAVQVPVSDFNMTMRMMGSLPSRAITLQQTHGQLHFVAFDYLNYLNLFDHCNTTQEVRSARLDYMLYDAPTSFFTASPVLNTTCLALLMGNAEIEGVMIKNLKGLYVPGGRPNNTWYKKKQTHYAHVVITGINMGKGKYSNTVGSVTYGVWDDNSSSIKEVGSCSGFTDVERANLESMYTYGNLVGQTILIKFNDTVGRGTPRFPVFVDWSWKKKEETGLK